MDWDWFSGALAVVCVVLIFFTGLGVGTDMTKRDIRECVEIAKPEEQWRCYE